MPRLQSQFASAFAAVLLAVLSISVVVDVPPAHAALDVGQPALA